MRRVKIVCTLGPACNDIEGLREMVEAGLNVARFNFSHGNYEAHGRTLEMIRRIESENDEPIGTILDTKGPEIRTGLLEGHRQVRLEPDSILTLVTEECEGNVEKVSISYPNLPDELVIGQDLYIDDGSIHLRVEGKRPDAIVCRVLVGGILGERKGINVPGADLSMKSLTEKDIRDIEWGMEHDMDHIAVSFVRNREDIMHVRRVVENYGDKRINIIAKIETRQAVENLEEIIHVVDGVMVARGDLGVEMATEEVPIVQKRIIELCRTQGKPVIVATQMLDSMIRNPRPTRAEASDVANAVLDGADAVMLSGETASGKYPVQSIQVMDRIVTRAEIELLRNLEHRGHRIDADNVADSVSRSATHIVNEIKAAAVIPLTRSGSTASKISKYRPRSPIIATTPLRSTWRSLALMWGVRPILLDEYGNTESAVDAAIAAVVKKGFVSEGDTVVITTGFPVFVSGTTNMLLVQTVGRVLFHAASLIKSEAAGFVCKAFSPEEAIEKMAKGNVLVVPSTDPRYLPALKKASAVITEEPGMTSHTAMSALHLGIPCITGVANVTSKLNDGMLITVDGVHGVVYEGRLKING